MHEGQIEPWFLGLQKELEPLGVNLVYTKSRNVRSFLHYSLDPDKDPSQPKGACWVRVAKDRAAEEGESWDAQYEGKATRFPGTPVITTYNELVHSNPLIYPGILKDRPLMLWWDFGGTNPAIVFRQQDSMGRLISHHAIKPNKHIADPYRNGSDGLVSTEFDAIDVGSLCNLVKTWFKDPNSPFYNSKWNLRIGGDKSGARESTTGVAADYDGEKISVAAQIIEREFKDWGVKFEYHDVDLESSIILCNDLFTRNIGGLPSHIVNPNSRNLKKMYQGGARYPDGKGRKPDNDKFYIHMFDADRYNVWALYRTEPIPENQILDDGYQSPWVGCE